MVGADRLTYSVTLTFIGTAQSRNRLSFFFFSLTAVGLGEVSVTKLTGVKPSFGNTE